MGFGVRCFRCDPRLLLPRLLGVIGLEIEGSCAVGRWALELQCPYAVSEQEVCPVRACVLTHAQVVMPAVTLEVRDLTVRTDALVGSAGIPTVGNTLTKWLKVGEEPTNRQYTLFGGC